MNTRELILAKGIRLSLSLAAAFWCSTSSADALYFGNSAGKIASYDTVTSNMNFSAPSSLQNVLALSSDGHLIGTDAKGTTLVEINAGDGTLYASFAAGSSISALAQVGNTAYFGAGNFAYGLSTSSLSLVWSRNMGSSVTSLTSQAPSQLFVGTNNGSLKSLDLASGAINYTYSNSSQSAINAISLGQSGQTYFGDAAGYLYSIDAVKGRLNFSYPGNGAVNQVASNSTSVFLVDSNGGISSFNAATGDYQFQYQTGSSLTQLALDANGSLYAAGVDGKIYDLNAATGKLIGTFAVGAAVKQLTLGGDGNLYALSGNTIYQVNSSTLGLVHSYASDSTVNSFALAAVPEPSSWALMLAGLVTTGLAAQRRKATRS